MEPMPARPGSSPQEKLGVLVGGMILLLLIALLCKTSGVVPVKPTCPTARQCDPSAYPAVCPPSGCCPTNTVWDTVQNCCTDKYGICAYISCSNPPKCKVGVPQGDPYACCPDSVCHQMKCISSLCLPDMRCNPSAYPETCPSSGCCPKFTVWNNTQNCCLDNFGTCLFICPTARECSHSAHPATCPATDCCPVGTIWNTTQNCCTNSAGVCVSFCPIERTCNPAANPATCPSSGCCPSGTSWGASGSSPEPCCLDGTGECATTPSCPAKRMCSHMLYPITCPSSGCCPAGAVWNATQKCCTNSAGVCVFACPAERTCDPVAYPATCPTSSCCPYGSVWNSTQNCCTDSHGTCVHCANPLPCNSSAPCCPGYTCNSTTERCEFKFPKSICTHHPSNCKVGPYNESDNETCCTGFYCNPNGLCCKEGWGCSYSSSSCYWSCNGEQQAPYPDCTCDCTNATCAFGGALDEYCVCHCSNDCHGGTYNMDCACNCGDPARQQQISETMCNNQPIHLTTDCSCDCQNSCNETAGGKRNDSNCQCDCSGVTCPINWAVNATDCTCRYIPPLCSALTESCTQNEDCCGYNENTMGYGYDAACYEGTCQNCTLTGYWGCGVDSGTGEKYRDCCNPAVTCDAANICPECTALGRMCATSDECCYHEDGAFCYGTNNTCAYCVATGSNCQVGLSKGPGTGVMLFTPKDQRGAASSFTLEQERILFGEIGVYQCCGSYDDIQDVQYAGYCDTTGYKCKSCRINGEECTQDSDCCPGVSCTSGICGGVACVPDGGDCSDDWDCCYSDCNLGEGKCLLLQ